MMLTKKLNNGKKVIGTNQTIKAIKNDKAVEIFIAKDIDGKIKDKIEREIEEIDIPINYIDSQLELGRACGIDVSAAIAARVK